MNIVATREIYYTGKGTPHHWVSLVDLDQVNPGVFVVRAWGKSPGTPKSMAFKSAAQYRVYHEKWKQEKIFDKQEEIGKFETIQACVTELESWFSWLNMKDHQQALTEVFGGSVPTPKPVVSKPQIPVQQLPETYGWW